MHILVGRALEELRRAGVLAKLVEGRDQLFTLRGGQDSDTLQRVRVGLRSADIDVHQPLVEVQRFGKALEGLGRACFESAAPEFHCLAASALTFIGRPMRLMKPWASF